jgi:integrase
MRQGELLALTWGDVDLVHSVIHVRHTYTDGNLGSPENHEKREVFVTEDIVDRLGSWWGDCGKPGDERLVLPGETKTGYLNPQLVLRRELYPAMERAGIPRVGPTGQKRTFHSLRHTFAPHRDRAQPPDLLALQASRALVTRRDDGCFRGLNRPRLRT